MLRLTMPKTMPKMTPVMLGAILTPLLMALVLIGPAYAAEPERTPRLPRDEARFVPFERARQVFRDDLTVDGGEVIEDDVFVYSGDVQVIDGGRITGDLIVFSGDIEIDESSSVDGNVTAYNGDVSIAGHVGGNLANMSGDVDLAASATVDGDISVVNGDLERDEGASVSGNVVQGPRFGFGGSLFDNKPLDPRGISFDPPKGPGFFGTVFGFIGRLFIAALLTAFTMLLVGGLFYMRPEWITDTRRRLNEQLAMSAVLGVLANLTLLFLAGLLAITICLLPLALIPMLGLLAVNVVGWAVASQIVGERIVSVAKQDIQPSLTILAGAAVITGVCALLWALGGCFRPLAFLLVLAISSMGTGAVLVPWINRKSDSSGSTGSGGDIPPSGPVGPTPPGPGAYTPERSTTVASSEVFTTPAATEGEVPEQDVAAPIDYVTAEEINAAAAQKPATPKSGPRAEKKPAAESTSSPIPVENEVVELDVAGPIDYVTAQEIVTTEAVTAGDDFLRIKGIGPTYARRLKDAGYQTYAQLAAASPEEVAAAIGWPVDRVRRSEVIDQAQMLARQS